MNWDFERNVEYTRSKVFKNTSQQENNFFEYGSKKPLPIQFSNNNNNSNNNVSSFIGKKDSRNEIGEKMNNYTPLASTQNLPYNNNSMFFDNRPINTRLENYK